MAPEVVLSLVLAAGAPGLRKERMLEAMRASVVQQARIHPLDNTTALHGPSASVLLAVCLPSEGLRIFRPDECSNKCEATIKMLASMISAIRTGECAKVGGLSVPPLKPAAFFLEPSSRGCDASHETCGTAPTLVIARAPAQGYLGGIMHPNPYFGVRAVGTERPTACSPKLMRAPLH